jgi:hypothetical protein
MDSTEHPRIPSQPLASDREMNVTISLMITNAKHHGRSPGSAEPQLRFEYSTHLDGYCGAEAPRSQGGAMHQVRSI